MKNLFIMALAAISFIACQQKNFKIDGTIKGMNEGKVFLHKLEKGRPVAIDTAEVVTEKFSFTGVEDVPQIYLIFAEGQQAPIFLFGENANISITAEGADQLKDAVVTGSPSTDIYNEFIQNLPEKKRMEEIQAEYQKAMMANQKEAMESLRLEAEGIEEARKAYIQNFVGENTNNAVGAVVTLQFMRLFEIENLKELVAKFEANLTGHEYVTELTSALEPMVKAAEAAKATEIGAVAPDFSLESITGDVIALSSLKGNYVLVDFWASWCKPCREESPNVVKAYNAYNAKGFDVLSVSLDRDSAQWKQAVIEDGLSWTQLIDAKGDIANSYGIQSIPFTLLLDKEGKIIAKNLRGDELEKKLAELLN